jgi:6-pyruvoyltetrahydropterin/6-carboxytetrahydropterin synthase
MPSCTRKFEFDAGHRVTRHESRCRNVHGHRYVAEVTVSAPELDDVGRVLDFGAFKAILGAWIDDNLDHGYIHHPDDHIGYHIATAGQKTFSMPEDLGEPTAENLVMLLFFAAVHELQPLGMTVEHVRLFETPNCWADYTRAEALATNRVPLV